MPIYTVHVPRAAADAFETADRAAFIREGFNGWAFVFGPLFLLRHRAWLAAAVWFVLVIGGGWLAAQLHLPGSARFALLVLLELFVGLEGNTFRRLALGRRGFDFADVVAGSRRADSELAFFRRREVRPSVAVPAHSARPMRPAAEPDRVIGLFPSQEG